MAGNTLLLVDDDETIRSLLGTLLGHKGFVVTTASSVLEALKLISSKQYL